MSYQFKDSKKKRNVQFTTEDVTTEDMSELTSISGNVNSLVCYPQTEKQCRQLLGMGWKRARKNLYYPLNLIMGDVPRTEMDLNRKEAAKSKFAKRVSTALHIGDVLLDIHSFRPVTPTDDWANRDVVLLTVEYKTCGELLTFVADSLRSDGLRVGIQPAAHYNLVQELAAKGGGKPILIEVNEKYMKTPMMDRISKAIARGVKGYQTVVRVGGHEENPGNVEALYKRFQSLPVDKKWNTEIPDWDQMKWNVLGIIKEIKYRCSKWSHSGGVDSKLNNNDKVTEHHDIVYFHPIKKCHPFLLQSGENYLIYGYMKVIPELRQLRYQPEGGIDDPESQVKAPGKGETMVDIPTPTAAAWIGRLISITYEDRAGTTHEVAFIDTDLVGIDKHGRVYLYPVKAAKSDEELVHFR